jgi:hypothetical protein
MNLKMTQAWGWLVAGVLAAGLNASYHDGGLQWAHQVADQISDRFSEVEHRSAAVLDLATGHADRFVSEVRLLTARQETPSCPWTTAMAQVQTRVAQSQLGLDRFEALSAQEEAQVSRFEANRARLEGQIAGQIQAQIAAQTAQFRIMANLAPVSFRAIQFMPDRFNAAQFKTIQLKAIKAPMLCRHTVRASE